MEHYVDLAELARAAMLARRGQRRGRPAIRRRPPGTLPAWQRWLLTCMTSLVLVVGAWRPMPVGAVPLPGDAEKLARAHKAMSLEAENRRIADSLEAIAAELRRVQPAGAASPDPADIAVRGGERSPLVVGEQVLAKLDALGAFETAVEQGWREEAAEMARRGMPAQVVARHEALIAEFRGKASEFRDLATALRNQLVQRSLLGTATTLVSLSDWMSRQDSARAFRAISNPQLPMQLARADRTPGPGEGLADARGNATKAYTDPPGPVDLAQTVDIQFTPAIQQLAQSLGGQPVAIRNWVHDQIEFMPTWGSIQGADQTLLNRRGNAFDIASLTLAMLRSSGTPARYVCSVVELPVEQVQNWLDAPTPQIALDLMQKGGIPSAAVMVAGRMQAIRFEHVWVEAWVDFIPSRGAINRVPDQWVPLDVAFKQHDVIPALPWRAPAQAAMQAALSDMASQIIVDPDGGIRGLDIERYLQPMGQLSRQLQSTIVPTVDGEYALFDRRNIRPIGSNFLEGTLPFPLRSASVQRFSEVPATDRHALRMAYYRNSASLTADAPAFEVWLPLARVGSQRLSVEYVGATPADQTALASYAADNDVSLPAGQIEVVARLRLGTELLHESAPARYGTLQYWRADLRDAHGGETSAEPYRFPAGTAIAFGVNAAGMDADRVERRYQGLPEVQGIALVEYLERAGDLFWLLHDHLDARIASSSGARALRLPSAGGFATALSVRYFFGVPRTASTTGFVTDVKVVRLGLSVAEPQMALLLAAQMGSSGAMQEGAVWSLLSGDRPGQTGLSAPSLIGRALAEGQKLFQISAANVDAALASMTLSVDAENEIRSAVAAGNTVVAHQRELEIGSWRGSGYTIIDPNTGSQLQRVEGGFAGGIDLGCILKAVVLTVICKNRFFASAKRILQSLINVVNAGAMGADLLSALGEVAFAIGAAIALGAVVAAFPLVGAVMLALSVVIAFIETYQWLKGLMEQLEEMTPEERAEAGITAVNEAICNYNPACFEGFNEAMDNLSNMTGIGADQEAADGRESGTPLVGNPVAVGTGAKWEYAIDHEAAGPFPLVFRRVYHSQLPNTESWLGPRWTGSYFQSLRLPPNTGGQPASPGERPNQVLLLRPDGGWIQFDWRCNAYVTEQNIPGRLERMTSGGQTAGWRYHTAGDLIEQYDAVGRLQSIRNRAGLAHTISRDSLGRPETVTDSFGRTLHFGYDAESGLLSRMTDTNSRVTGYERGDFDRLERVVYPGDSDRLYHYEDPLNRYALTGVTDERGIRTATWQYDSQGRVTLYQRAGGVDRHAFRYEGNRTYVTDPLGTERTYEYLKFGERPYLRVVTQPCSACSAGGLAERFYDSRGLLVRTRDFNGNQTVYERDDDARITSMTQALDSDVERTTTIEWTPAWRLPRQVVEPITGGTRTTTIVYDNEGNPDTRTVVADGETRTWAYSHNGNGQIETEDGPRTDVADVTSYTYDANGNLETRTDALQHVWRYTQYDQDGQLRRMEDPNGLVTTYNYDLRQRLTSVDEGGEITGYRYDDAGHLERITLPDQSYIEYTWDDAGRIERVEDNLGHAIDYELDELGNRTKEETFDPQGTLVQTLRRVYDGLGRLEDTFGAEDQQTHYTYDGNGNEKSARDPLLRLTRYDYDELNRLKKTTDPDDQEIEFSYDAQDNLRTVTDPRDLVTEYQYTGFDELRTLDSPDTGVTSYTYDPAGNLETRTDSRDVTADYGYDANQRLRTINYPAFAGQPPESLVFTYDDVSGGNHGKGRLTAISDGSGSTRFRYDLHGRVLAKTQTVGTGAPRTLETSYLPNGQVEGHVLPSGAIVRYTYRADGRMLTVRVNGVEIVRAIDYHAFGEPKSWQYGTADVYQRVFDLDGRIEQHSAGSAVRSLRYDEASRIETQADSAGGPNQWTYGYDDLDRLETATNTGAQGAIANLALGWDYDPTGNRTQETRGANPPVPFVIAPTSNRLDSVDGQSRSYDAAGNTTNDGAGTTSVYSARNRLIRTTRAGLSTHYAHNAFGERVCKASAGPSCVQSADRIEYVYDDDGHLIGEYAPSLADHSETLWLGDTPIALLKRRPSSSDGGPGGGGTPTAWSGMPAGGVDVYFIHPDHLDTPRVVVNVANAPVWRWDSAPFGDSPANENPTAGLPSFTYNLRFPGQQYDRETGTHYNYFRDYEAQTGRYVQSDPVGLWDGPGTYSYTGSDPIAFIDFDGEKRSRGGRGVAIKKIESDPKQPRCVRGWLKNERRHAAGGGRAMQTKDGKWRREGNKYIRLPPGFDLAHLQDQASCSGCGYENTVLQNEQVHDIQTEVQREFGRF